MCHLDSRRSPSGGQGGKYGGSLWRLKPDRLRKQRPGKLFGKDDNSCRYRLHAYVSHPFLLGKSQGVVSDGKGAAGTAADDAGAGRKSTVAAPAECAGRAAEIETQRP